MVEVGTVSKELIVALKVMLKSANWKIQQAEDRDFKTWFPVMSDINIKDYGEITNAFFLCLPPGGRLHKHIDTPRVERTFHIPVKTNKDALSYDQGTSSHAKVGNVYEIDRSVEHWAVNNGKADRIHLIIECLT